MFFTLKLKKMCYELLQNKDWHSCINVAMCVRSLDRTRQSERFIHFRGTFHFKVVGPLDDFTNETRT